MLTPTRHPPPRLSPPRRNSPSRSTSPSRPASTPTPRLVLRTSSPLRLTRLPPSRHRQSSTPMSPKLTRHRASTPKRKSPSTWSRFTTPATPPTCPPNTKKPLTKSTSVSTSRSAARKSSRSPSPRRRASSPASSASKPNTQHSVRRGILVVPRLSASGAPLSGPRGCLQCAGLIACGPNPTNNAQRTRTEESSSRRNHVRDAETRHP